MKNQIIVGIFSYYDISMIMEGASDGTRENGNNRWIEFYNSSKKRNIHYELYNIRNHKSYDVILIRDIPRIFSLAKLLLSNLLKKKVPLLILLEETPIARNRQLLNFDFLFDKVCVATSDKNYKINNKRYSTFCHASIPNKNQLKISKEKFIYKKREKLLCYVSRKKSALNQLSTYKKRNSLVKNLCLISDEFDLYGSGWDRFTIPMDMPLIALILKFKKQIISIGSRFILKIRSKGSPKEKLKVMEKYKFCLAFEPYIGKPYSALEKIFDPMLSGCIPVYLGIDSEKIKVPQNTFIKIDRNITGKELLNKIKNITSEEEILIRKNIYNYLNSNDANCYRYETFSNFLIEELIKLKVN